MPIFIIANHRSGTTMLRLMLTSHSKIAIPNELEIIELVDKHFDDDEIQANELPSFFKLIEKNGRFQDWQIPISEIETAARALGTSLTKAKLVEIFYKKFMAKSGEGKTIWGDKTIGTVTQMLAIADWFPDGRVIHLVRDPRDVALSMRKNFTHPPLTGFPDRRRKLVTDVVGGAMLWAQGEWLIEEGKIWFDEDKVLTIKYSDLVNQPERTLQQVCQFLEIEFEREQMLNFHKKNRAEKLISERRLKIHQQTLEPVSNSRENLYQSELSALEILTVNYLCRPYLARHGFAGEQPKFWQMPLVWARIGWYFLKYFFQMGRIYASYFFKKLG